MFQMVIIKSNNLTYKRSVLAALHHKEIDRHFERANKYKQWKVDLNFDNITFSSSNKRYKEI